MSIWWAIIIFVAAPLVVDFALKIYWWKSQQEEEKGEKNACTEKKL